jgi:hypothetical protein
MCAHNQLLVLWTQLAPLNPNHSLTIITYMQMPTCGFMWTCKWYFLAVQVSHGWMNQRAIKDWQIWVQLYLKKVIDIGNSPPSPHIGTSCSPTSGASSWCYLGGCNVYYVWESRAFMTPPKKALVYARLFVSIPLYIPLYMPLYLRNTAVFKLIPLLCTHVYSYMFSIVLPPRVLH